MTIDPRCSWRLLRPVVAVWRWRDALQIDRTLVVSPAPARAPAVLAALSRPATAASLDAAFPELGMAWLTGFLSALLDAGLLGWPGCQRPPPRRSSAGTRSPPRCAPVCGPMG
ncbi:MAG: hypothetical protein HZY73_09730 [Micropruina sp.]|nr:MAG: hypothetical protein HZY73_09730 [Micropruina sp.]